VSYAVAVESGPDAQVRLSSPAVDDPVTVPVRVEATLADARLSGGDVTIAYDPGTDTLEVRTRD
jgi:hypothetical protein